MSIQIDTYTHKKEAGPVSSPAPSHEMFETNRGSEGTQGQKGSNAGRLESQRPSQSLPLAFSLCLQWYPMACPPEGLELGLLLLIDCTEFPHRAGRLGLRWKGHLPAVSRSFFSFLWLGVWKGRKIKMRINRGGIQSSFSLQEWLFSYLGVLGIAAFTSVHTPRLTLVASVAILRLHPRASGPIGKHLGHSSNNMKAEQRAQSGQVQRVASRTKMALGKAPWS